MSLRSATRLSAPLAILAVAASLAVVPPVAAQPAPDLAAMLDQAQRFTVKVRATVLWPFAPEQLGSGQGTGFIVDREKGWIITNAHVAKRSPAAVEIALGDTENDWIAAERLYVDNYLDVAVLRVAPDKLPLDAAAAKLGCTQPVKQGSTVVAYGHPINLSFTATRGIVSSVRALGNQEFVQMDANINPGNSGGPLLSAEAAEVIGINTANFPGAPGLGLATSIRHVCPVLAFLTKGQDPSVPSIPVYWLKQGRIETLTVAASFPRSGSDSRAPDATRRSLLPGDVVQSIVGGSKIATLPDLYTALRGKTAQVSLTVLREGKPVDAVVALLPPRPPMRRQALTFAGLMITERVNLDTADQTLPPLRIEFLRSGELAARSGLQPWDQIEAVDGKHFTTVEALHTWLAAQPPKTKIALLVRRFSGLDPRVTADYHRFEIVPTDLKLLTAGE